MIRPGQARNGPGGTGSTAAPLTLKDVDAIDSQISGVVVATPSNSRMMTVIFGNTNYSTNITGTDNRYLVATDWPIAEGREFYDSELRSGTAACILGETVRQELFGSSSPLGEVIRIKQISCRVIGVLDAKGASSFGSDQDDLVLIPIRAFHRRVAGNQDVSMIYASIRDSVSTDKAKADIERLMRERRRISPGEDDDFNVFDTEQITSMLTGITTVLTGLLSAVAAVSLLVGGHRHYEHHARVRHRKNPRDRYSSGGRRDRTSGVDAVSGRSNRALADRRTHRHSTGSCSGVGGRKCPCRAVCARHHGHPGRLWVFSARWRLVWLFSRAPRRPHGSD